MRHLACIPVLIVALFMGGCTKSRTLTEFRDNHPYAVEYRLVDGPAGMKRLHVLDFVPRLEHVGTNNSAIPAYVVETHEHVLWIRGDEIVEHTRGVYWP